MISEYQAVGFHFEVSFHGLGAKGGSIDGRFQSVSGLKMEFQTETVKEGGENDFEHELPTRRKYSDLVLKRGILSRDSGSILTEWCMIAFDYYVIAPIPEVTIILFNENHQPLMKWVATHVWPKSWEAADLNAEESKVLIETITLSINRLFFKKP